MPKIPEGAKVPQDHKKPASKLADDCFTFELDGKRFTSSPLKDVLTPKYIRVNRRRDDLDFMFTLIEDLFGDDDDAMEALDSMTWAQNRELQAELQDAMRAAGASLGE